MNEQKGIIRQKEDSREFVELLKALPDEEKAQVKGIMIGLVISRQQRATTALTNAAVIPSA